MPGLICNKPESSELGAVTTGIGLQNAQEPHIDAQNIGFAVTNGSNPRRRSRSVGAYRDTDHRSSPIQWRQWRRSDEIKYWRQSADRGSLGITRFESPEPAQKYDVDTVGNDGGGLGEHNEDFNFGLSDVALPIRDRIGLEERLVTLEIKLMDFEYAIAKLQAGSLSPSRRYSQQFETSKRQNSFSSYTSSSDNLSPALSQGSPPENPSKFGSDQTPNLRPTSVATTLKAGTSGQYSWPRKGSADSVVRSSLTGLTIDHYTTLVTLVRCEQNARIQLEHQVSMLQQRLDQISPPHSSYPRVQPLSQHLHSRSLSSQQRRHGFVDTATREDTDFGNLRRRSSNHSTDGTDTDDDAYHEVYVTPDITPVERGGHERGAFERVAGVEEGMAF